MDLYTFISEMTKALIWPLTTFAVFLVLRKPLTTIISLTNRFKIKDMEIEFDSRIKQLHKETTTLLSPDKTGSPDSRKEQLIDIARISPRSAILESWLELEDTSLKKLKNKKVRNIATLSPIELGDILLKYKLLDKRSYRIFNQLRNLRNAAVHAANLKVTPETAYEYVDMAASITSLIEKSNT